MDVLSPYLGGGLIFTEVPPLTNNTAKTSFGDDLVKIRPAVAKQSCQTQRKTKHKTATKIDVAFACSERHV